MLRTALIFLLPVAACAPNPEGSAPSLSNSLVSIDDGSSATGSTDKAVLFDMPESALPTECAAADAYPDRRIQPSFYGNPDSLEYKKYIACVVAEARRDGDRVRLASPSSFPRTGTCYSARITYIGSRFGDDAPGRDAGTTVVFDNGLSLVDYGLVPGVARSRVGDAVRACVHDLPKHCPAHDLRGIGYSVRNLRNGQHWQMGDSQHLCRGA